MFVESLAFILSSLITLTLSYYNLPTRTLQQIVVIILVILLLFLIRFPSLKEQHSRFFGYRFLLFILSSTFIQLLVAITGGFYSPFLILLHLFAIGVSFLLSLPSSIIFLGASLITLTLNIFLNPNMFKLFQDDPFSVALYVISFIVIVPLSSILTRSYHLKGAISKMLSEYIKIEERREESILIGLSELIIVTDKNLKILSVNNATERAIHLTNGDVAQKNLLEIIPLNDKDGKRVDAASLSIDQALQDKAVRIVTGFYFAPKNNHPAKVDVQVRPIFDLDGQINQIVFVLSDPETKSRHLQKHSDLEQTKIKRQALIGEFKKFLYTNNLTYLYPRLELLTHIDDDLITALDIEDHIVKEAISLEDLAIICNQVIQEKQHLAQSLGVNVHFNLPQESAAEYALIHLQNSNIPKNNLPPSPFTAPIDPKWFKIALQKILELSIFLVSGQKNSVVSVTISTNNPDNIDIKLALSFPKLEDNLMADIFKPNYGSLSNSTNLHLSSGLEGFIAQKIAFQINLPITTTSEGLPPHLVFLLQASRQAQNN